MQKTRLIVGILVILPSCREPVSDRAPIPSPRIVSLLPNATETLFALGLGDHLVGATRYCDRPDAARALPRVGGILDPSVEAVIAARPDLVVGSPSVLRGHLADTLGRMGARLIPLTFETLEDVRAGIRILGEEVGRPEEATTLLSQIDSDLARLKNRAAKDPPLRVLFVVGRTPLVVAGGGSFLGHLLDLMGVENVVPAAGVAFPTWSLEQVLHADPDVVVNGAVETGDLAMDLASVGLAAAKQGRVILPPDPAIIRPGPAMVRAAIALAEEILRVAEAR